MTDLPFSKVLKVFFHDRYSAIGDLTASNENEVTFIERIQIS